MSWNPSRIVQVLTRRPPLGGVLGLTDLELLVVEVEFLALKDVTIGTTALTRSGSDDGEETTSLELLLENGVDFSILLALVENSLDVVGLRLLGGLLGSLGTSVDGLGVVGLVPLTEGGSVDVNNGGLDKGLGSEKLVVGSVVSLGLVVLLAWLGGDRILVLSTHAPSNSSFVPQRRRGYLL
jgi:hypothetical protein